MYENFAMCDFCDRERVGGRRDVCGGFHAFCCLRAFAFVLIFFFFSPSRKLLFPPPIFFLNIQLERELIESFAWKMKKWK